MMTDADIWATLVPQKAKIKYKAMEKEHLKAMGNAIYETRESKEIRREMRDFYDFQVDAIKRKIYGQTDSD